MICSCHSDWFEKSSSISISNGTLHEKYEPNILLGKGTVIPKRFWERIVQFLISTCLQFSLPDHTMTPTYMNAGSTD